MVGPDGKIFGELKFTAGSDPYAVSDNFYSQSMDEWPKIEFLIS